MLNRVINKRKIIKENLKSINLKLYIKSNVNQQNLEAQLRLVSYMIFLKLKIKEIKFASIHLHGEITCFLYQNTCFLYNNNNQILVPKYGGRLCILKRLFMVGHMYSFPLFYKIYIFSLLVILTQAQLIGYA